MDLGVSREEVLQGFSAVEIWEEGAEGYIVLEGVQDPAHKCFGSINTKKNTAINPHLTNFLAELDNSEKAYLCQFFFTIFDDKIHISAIYLFIFCSPFPTVVQW